MRVEHCKITLAPREVILSKLSDEAKNSQLSFKDIENNVPSFISVFGPDIDLKAEDETKWYCLISNVTDSLMTSITNTLVNFKRGYLNLLGPLENNKFDVVVPDIIIDFDGVEIDDNTKEAVQKLAEMLLGEYNPKVI